MTVAASPLRLRRTTQRDDAGADADDGAARALQSGRRPRRRAQENFMNRSLVAALPTGWLLLFLGPSAMGQDAQRPPVEMAPAAPAAPVQVQVQAAPAEPAAGAPAAGAPGPVVVEKDQKKVDTTRELEDGGLGLEWVYLNADVGAAGTDLASLKSSNWQLQDNSASGPAFGIGA